MYQNRDDALEVIALYRADYKSRFYLRQVGKLAKLPLRTCQNVLARLESERVLKSKVEGKNRYFSLNLDNILTKSYLLRSEIHKADAFLEKYTVFKTFMKSVNTNAAIIIFGSFARLAAEKGSDVDLLIVSNKAENLPAHLMPYKMHEIRLSESSFSKALAAHEPLMGEIAESHILLNNPSAYLNLVWGQAVI